MSSLKADFFLEEKVNVQLSNSEPKSVPPRVLLTHYNVITLLVLILFTFLIFTNNALSQPMKFLYDQIIQENNLSFITVTRTSNQITLKINYTNLDYTIDSTENGWYINMENFGSSGIQGAPDLPYRTYTLELPANVIFNSISVTIDSIYSTAAGNYTPFKPVIQYIDTLIYDEPDEIIYNTESYYPTNPISISSPSNLRNWVFTGFELYPFQYNPVSGNLIKIDSISYNINFEVSRDSIPIDSTKVPGYCIITTQAIKDSSEKLEEFRLSKERIGFDCFVVTVDSLDTCNFTDLQAPGERPEKIRRYLQENYIEKNIEYALLIGNPKPKNPFEPNKEVGDVPMKYILSCLNPTYKNNYWVTKYNIENKYSTDYYYADLTGNWDLDSDGFYGENAYYSASYSYPPGIINDTFSIKYEGWIIIPYNTNTTPPSIYKGYFIATYNDGFRLWINDTLCNNTNINSKYYFSDSNSWSDNIEGYGYTSPDTLNFFRSGDTLKIKIEYYNKQNDYFLNFYYTGYSIKQILDNTWFFCGDSIQNTVQGGLKASYYNNTTLNGEPIETVTFKRPEERMQKGDTGENGVDFLPEVHIGRVPVYNNNYCVLDSLMQRFINYQYNNDSIEWRKSILLPIHEYNRSFNSFKVGENIRKIDTINFFSFRIYRDSAALHTMFIKNYNYLTFPISVDTVKTIWNKYPFGIVTFHGHGAYEEIPDVMTSVETNNLDKKYPSFVFQGSCNTGFPDSSKNLGYMHLKNQSISTISSSGLSHLVGNWEDTLSTSKGVYQWCYLFSKGIMKNNTIGEVLSKLKKGIHQSQGGSEHNNTFGFNLYGEPSLKLNSIVQTVPLTQGWNLVSSYLISDRSSMNSTLWGINKNLRFAKNYDGEYCKPDSVDDIGMWNYKEAYQIYMNSADTLYIAGRKINPILDTIPLNSGWNWVAYLRNSNMSIDTSNALKSIKNNLLMAKNGTGLLYIPQWGINQIGNMLPNQGYEISVNGACNLVYPQDSTTYNYKAILDETTILSPVAKKLTPFVTNTGNDCTLIFDDLSIPDGYEIGIINGDGLLIGAGAVQNQVCALTVWGKDKLNNSEGATKGEELFAFTIDTTNNRIQEIEISNIQDFLTKENINTLTYEKGKIYVCNANAELTAINENMYITNQPNPFNDQTEITYKIPEAGNVVVNISSIHGEIVAIYNQGNQDAGIYNIQFDGSNLLGGVYVIDLIFENERVQSVMILIK